MPFGRRHPFSETESYHSVCTESDDTWNTVYAVLKFIPVIDLESFLTKVHQK